MPVITSAGTRIYIGTTAANPVGDTYTEIGEIVTGPEFGREYQIIEHIPLSDRGVNKLKGSFDEGSPQLGIGRDLTDAGQDAARAALEEDEAYNFKIEFNDLPAGAAMSDTPTTTYFKALVSQFTTNVGDANSIVAGTLTLAIISGSVQDVELSVA